MEPDILDRIDRIQARYPDLIRASINVHEEYGVSRSFWERLQLESTKKVRI